VGAEDGGNAGLHGRDADAEQADAETTAAGRKRGTGIRRLAA
jgi:hypothetical protein